MVLREEFVGLIPVFRRYHAEVLGSRSAEDLDIDLELLTELFSLAPCWKLVGDRLRGGSRLLSSTCLNHCPSTGIDTPSILLARLGLVNTD